MRGGKYQLARLDAAGCCGEARRICGWDSGCHFLGFGWLIEGFSGWFGLGWRADWSLCVQMGNALSVNTMCTGHQMRGKSNPNSNAFSCGVIIFPKKNRIFNLWHASLLIVPIVGDVEIWLFVYWVVFAYLFACFIPCIACLLSPSQTLIPAWQMHHMRGASLDF